MGASTRSAKKTTGKTTEGAKGKPGAKAVGVSAEVKGGKGAKGKAGAAAAGGDSFVAPTLRSRAIEGPEQVKEILAAASPKVRELAETLRRLVRKAAPDALETGQRGGLINFERKKPFCYINPQAEHMVLGFHRGSDLDDPENILGAGAKGPRTIRVAAVHDIRGGAFERFVRQARDLAAK